MRTSISPQTLSSFPLTFFFAITFNATSCVIPDDDSPGVVGKDPEEGFDGRPFCEVEGPAAAPRSAMLTCSAGTFHVAR